jgi:hypothetical protein
VRRVLELLATSESRASVSKLCTISKAVLWWLTPILDRTVVFKDQATLNIFKSSYNARYPELRTPTMVRHLFFARGVSGRVNLRDFSGLQHLVTEPAQLMLSPPRRIPCLTHLTVHTETLGTPFHLPFFQTITHLYLPDQLPTGITLSQFTPATLPNLTHLVCTIIVSGNIWHDEDLLAFFTSLHHFRKLRVVGLQPSHFHRRPHLPTFLQAIGHQGHPKLVFIPTQLFSMNVCESWLSGDENIWDMAERMLLVQIHAQGQSYSHYAVIGCITMVWKMIEEQG